MLEVFLRNWIEKLVDHGAPYVENASKFGEKPKYDFAIARSLQGGSISLGQLISHSVQLSQLDSIVSIFDTLLGENFFSALSKVRDRWQVELHGEEVPPIIVDLAKLRKTLAKLFETRHILVHEMPAQPPHTLDEVSEFLDQAAVFLQAAEELFATSIYGDYPLTQGAMNADAARQRDEATTELEELCAKIEISSESTKIREVQSHWEAFAEAEANRVTEWEMGGSIRPMIYHSAFAALAKDRSRQLEEWLGQDTDQNEV